MTQHMSILGHMSAYRSLHMGVLEGILFLLNPKMKLKILGLSIMLY
jgi:hypothetical protein